MLIKACVEIKVKHLPIHYYSTSRGTCIYACFNWVVLVFKLVNDH